MVMRTIPALAQVSMRMKFLISDLKSIGMERRGQAMNGVKSEILVFDRKLMEERDYWIKTLSREIPSSNLRLDYRRPESYQGERCFVEFDFGEDVCLALTNLTGGSQFLLYTTLMAALKICLHKYTGNTCVIVGSPALRREGDSLGQGSALAIVDEVDEQARFREFLLKVRKTLSEAYARQKYAFSRVVRDLGLEGLENRCALFDVAVSLKGFHHEMPELKNDIVVTFTCDPGRISGNVEFNKSLFNLHTIQNFTGHFVNLLREALQDTNTLIADLSMMTEKERHQILVSWNDTRANYSRALCVHQLFEQQAELSPEATAVAYEDQSLSYRQLNERANQMAHYLRGKEVGPEQVVGVCLERSLEMVIALLAVLKAGAAYLPLDGEYPPRRLKFMLDDSQLKVLITHSNLRDRLPPHSAQTIYVDRDWQPVSRHSITNVDAKVSPDNLAYVIYTSGSTGKPKGVMISHKAISNRLLWMSERFAFTPSDSVLQKTALSFDASVWEVFEPLITGGRVVLARAGGHRDSRYLIEEIKRRGVSVVQVVPSMLRVVMEEAALAECERLRLVFSGGEELSRETVERFYERVGEKQRTRLVNLYGPTEAAIDATYWESDKVEAGRKVPIGRPIGNVRVYVMDEEQRLAAVGMSGEIYIGGEGVARGYLNRAELTAEKFIADRFSATPGGRLYKTGDLARYLPDGNIEYLGRKDHQIKVRGHRIELGEIEAIIKQQGWVRDAVVLVSEQGVGGKRLIGYVVAEEERGASMGGLREILEQELPEVMVPTRLIKIEAIPMTANGKTDRKALLAYNNGSLESREAYVAPRNPVEEVMAGIWAKVLEVEQVGVFDNFFNLSGNSLLATQLISRIREAFRLELPLRSLFEAPTVADLSLVLSSSEINRGQVEKIAAVLKTVEHMSTGEVMQLLDDDTLNGGSAR
jgi:amino acid adenylation domain-containing protein